MIKEVRRTPYGVRLFEWVFMRTIIKIKTSKDIVSAEKHIILGNCAD